MLRFVARDCHATEPIIWIQTVGCCEDEVRQQPRQAEIRPRMRFHVSGHGKCGRVVGISLRGHGQGIRGQLLPSGTQFALLRGRSPIDGGWIEGGGRKGMGLALLAIATI